MERKILEIVAKVYGVKVSDIKGKSRKRRLCESRRMAFLVLNNKTRNTPGEVTEILNRHRTVQYYYEGIQDEIRLYKDVAERHQEILNQLESSIVNQ